LYVSEEVLKVKMAQFNRLRNNEAFLRYLHSANLRKRKQLLQSASREEIKSLCECAFNILRKNVPLSPSHLAELRKPKVKRTVYQLVNKRIPLTQKRKVLIQAGGAFPFALLAPIIASVIGAVASTN
jgi:hypothetical protein